MNSTGTLLSSLKRKATDEPGIEQTHQPKRKRFPESVDQLRDGLVSLEQARILLQSKWPLKKIRELLTGSWINYQGVRERKKVCKIEQNYKYFVQNLGPQPRLLHRHCDARQQGRTSLQEQPRE